MEIESSSWYVGSLKVFLVWVRRLAKGIGGLLW